MPMALNNPYTLSLFPCSVSVLFIYKYAVCFPLLRWECFLSFRYMHIFRPGSALNQRFIVHWETILCHRNNFEFNIATEFHSVVDCFAALTQINVPALAMAAGIYCFKFIQQLHSVFGFLENKYKYRLFIKINIYISFALKRFNYRSTYENTIITFMQKGMNKINRYAEIP